MPQNLLTSVFARHRTCLFSIHFFSSGLKPSTPAKPQQVLTKQEIAEVCRRRSVEEMEESDERIKGIGYQRYIKINVNDVNFSQFIA